AMVQAKKYKEVIGQYNVLLLINPANPFYRFYRGVAEYGLGNMAGAITDFEVAYRSNTKDVSSVCAYNLIFACDSVHDETKALFYANEATKLGMAPQPDIIKTLQYKQYLASRKHRDN
ncbi:MAG TPA: tetratricopeptide repeat protein, partial [Bacteroidia bacterium]|nr:tetratricopeptide repeat protein [Bacteroidia bacterium]